MSGQLFFVRVKLSVSCTKLVIDMESGNDLLKTALEAAYSISRCYVDNLDRTPVGATASLEQLRRQLAKPLGDEGLPPGQVIAELSNDVEGGLHTCAGGRFFGWVRGGAVPASLGADWLTSVWDQNAALYSVGPAAAVVEEVAGAWLKELLGLPAGASFAFVTGTQMAHLTCLAAARHELLARRGWDVEQLGLYGARESEFSPAISATERWNGRFACLALGATISPTSLLIQPARSFPKRWKANCASTHQDRL